MELNFKLDEIKDSETSAEANVQDNNQESIDNTQEGQDNTLEIKLDGDTEKPQKPTATMTKHIVTFIGNGIWMDNHGDSWHRGHHNENIKSEREYTDEEFVNRNDLKFMISYGAMKHTKVSF